MTAQRLHLRFRRVIGWRGGGVAARAAGFVLLEALVALAIIGLVALSLLQARGQQIRVAAQARELLAAQALAEDRLGSIRILDYAGLADPADSVLAGTFPEPFQTYSWTAEIEPMEEELDLFHVDVVVNGPAERFPLATLIHRPRPTRTAAGGNAGRGGGAGGGGGGGGRGGGGGGGGRGGGR